LALRLQRRFEAAVQGRKVIATIEEASDIDCDPAAYPHYIAAPAFYEPGITV
jgi:hypothetical protein